jgi:exodeoxyribonuclease V alpha subunit
MTDLAVSLGPGLLRDVHEAGVLSWGDVHVAQKVSHLFGEGDQRVQLALALTTRALRQGSTCLELDHIAQTRFETDAESVVQVPEDLWPETEQWRLAIAASPMVRFGDGIGGDRPLRLVGQRLYLERYWQEESTVAEELLARRAAITDPPTATVLTEAAAELLRPAEDADQAVAAVVPLFTGVSVIAGGPGTGKTYTLARVLGMLSRSAAQPLLIALAAPTGKAAVRMDESMAKALTDMPTDLATDLGALRATTIHRLLGWVPDARNRFRHNRTNPLPHDVVVIDEASMVSVTLMARLLEALRPAARLVLVGDPNQLAPVEAGAVLADIVEAPAAEVPALRDGLAGLGLPGAARPVAVLRRNHRSGQAIAELADAVLAGDADAVERLATAGRPEVSFAESAETSGLRDQVAKAGVAMVRAARRGDVAAALTELESHRLLCAHRHGPFGVSNWSHRAESWISDALADFDPSPLWYAGRPVLVTQNSPELGLFNGDTGVVVEAEGQLRVYFARGGRTQAVSPFVLDAVQTIHAMTVHKAQGSQFAQVSLILPDPDSPLLTRELLYTAITRAEQRVNLIGSIQSLRSAVANRARRASGLLARL